jgi:hypothetical protein
VPAQEVRAAASEPPAFERLPFGPVRRGPRATPTQSASQRWSRARRRPPSSARRSMPVPSVDRARCRRSRRAGAGPALGAVRLRAPAVRCRSQAWTARDADAVGEPALVPPSAPFASERRPFVAGARRGPRAMPTQSASLRWSHPRHPPPAKRPRSLPVLGVDPRAMPTQSASRRWSPPSTPSAFERPPCDAGPKRGPRAMPTQSASRRWYRPRRRPPSSARRSMPVPSVDRARCRRSRPAGAGPALGPVRLRALAFVAGARRGPARNADAVGEPALVPPSTPSAFEHPPFVAGARRGPRAMPTQSASRRWSRLQRRLPSSTRRSLPVPGVDRARDADAVGEPALVPPSAPSHSSAARDCIHRSRAAASAFCARSSTRGYRDHDPPRRDSLCRDASARRHLVSPLFLRPDHRHRYSGFHLPHFLPNPQTFTLYQHSSPPRFHSYLCIPSLAPPPLLIQFLRSCFPDPSPRSLGGRGRENRNSFHATRAC